MNRLRHLPPMFWIGLLPVILLLGVWADSLFYFSEWRYSEFKDRSLRVALKPSVLEMESHWIEAPRVPTVECDETGPWGDWHRHRAAPEAERIWFPLPSSVQSIKSYSRKTLLHSDLQIIPFWFVLLAWLPLWLGLAGWQAWHKTRKLRAAEQAITQEAEAASC
ncbi:hypothetical protein [Haloferula sp. BvORR071]|uniref:hypothetical protein n=1 Tax=Haloferula sp. BvORR071 TaxID=1396141 RepID=UPI002240F6AB|nr:hypothetical protein [Haloferula sp. BvORR071]